MDDATELAVRRARDQYPMGDAELAGELGAGSPDTVARIMQRTHEAAVRAGQQATAQRPAGVPVPSDNATRAAESEDARHIREMRHKVRQRPGRSPGKNRTLVEPWEAEEFRDLAFKVSWNNHMEARRTGRSNVSEPPRGVPAAPTLAPMGASF
jgi:hypothetical protein